MSVIILAIESSCDETSAAIIIDGQLKSNVIASQIAIHELYGGVVPEIASRNHLLKISTVVEEALKEANVTFEDLTSVAVTYGPGLVGALLVGVSYAKALSFRLGIPLIKVNHIAGHISANFLVGAKPPFICLAVSGGHTYIVKVDDYTSFKLLGTTRDDAAGEAFDKVARVMGLPYPGGPKLDNLANEGDDQYISFPRVMVNDGTYDFSFSGLKSNVLNYINKAKMKNEPIDKAGLCASFRKCIIDILVAKTISACKNEGLKTVAICGGVACNSLLRSSLKEECEKNGFEFFCPDKILCSDNAGMIASAAYRQYLNNDFTDYDLNADPNAELNFI